MIIVVVLTVRSEAMETFRAYEREAAIIMAAYGARIERTVVVTPATDARVFKEVHLVRFPDESAFVEYRRDPRLRELDESRNASVVSTEILVGEDGPEYSGPS